MGREIRKVPVGWEHPKRGENDLGRNPDDFQPIYNKSYKQAAEKWLESLLEWQNGESEYKAEYQFYWEWDGMPPDPEDKYYYRPDWTEEEMNGFCLYETVSEGTPVSPVFATKKELAEYLAEHGDFWDERRGNPGWGIERARAFCDMGWAPSFIAVGGQNGGIIEGKLFMPEPNQK